MKNKWVFYFFFCLVCAALLAPLFSFKSLFFPYVTSKAFYFRILMEAALPFYVFLLLRDKSLRPNLRNPLTLAVLAFLLSSLLSGALGINFTRSFWGNYERMGGVFYLAHLTLLYFYALLLFRSGGIWLKRLWDLLLLVAVLVSINGLMGKLGLPTLVLDPSLPGRVSSTLGNPIFLASFLILPLAMSSFFLLQSETRKGKIYYACLSLLFLILIYFTGTRGAAAGVLLGALSAAAVYAFFAGGKKARLWGVAASGLIALIAAVLVLFSSSLPQGSVLGRLGRLDDANAQARLLQWQVAWQGFLDRPLLGTGPENYYYVANRNYNPELAKYDASWFDKPHNYILEILATGGTLTFLAYLALLLSGLYALWLARREELLSAGQTAVLFFGLAAYQIQNLFVFDTVPASISFFAFLAFLGYVLWEAGQGSVAPEKGGGSSVKLARGTALAAGLFAAYLIYVTNILVIVQARNINYGKTAADAQRFEESAAYFERALGEDVWFDFSALYQQYADMALAAGQSQAVVEQEFVDTVLERGEELGERAVLRDSTSPVNWYYLAALLFFDSQASGDVLPKRANEALARARELAPTRRELLYLDVKFKEAEENWEAALGAAENLYDLYPRFAESSWQLAWVRHQAGNAEAALVPALRALELGYKPATLAEHRLFIDNYSQAGEYSKAVEWSLRAVEFSPQNAEAYLVLLRAYLDNGQETEARTLVQQLIASEPALQGRVNEILESR